MYLDWDDLPEVLQSVVNRASEYIPIFENNGFNLIETAPFSHDAGAMFVFKNQGLPS